MALRLKVGAKGILFILLGSSLSCGVMTAYCQKIRLLLDRYADMTLTKMSESYEDMGYCLLLEEDMSMVRKSLTAEKRKTDGERDMLAKLTLAQEACSRRWAEFVERSQRIAIDSVEAWVDMQRKLWGKPTD